MKKCQFCALPSFTEGWTVPEMCEAHLELALIRARLNRADKRFDLGNVQRAYQEEVTRSVPVGEEGFRWTFTIDRIPELMRQMLAESY